MIVEALLRLVADPPVALALGAGTTLGLTFGITPGLSGRIGLLIAMPWALAFDPFAGAVFLIALHAVVHTTSAIPAILFGVPTSASEAATVIDGYPMMRANRGAEAIGGMLTASALGGIAGALALIGLVPVMVPLISHVGTPEVAMLALVGLASVSALAGANLPAAIATAALGVLASTVGVDDATGTPRYTFGRLELWDGADVAAVIAGLFVIPELLSSQSGAGIVAYAGTRVRDVVRASIGALAYGFLIARAAAIGILVGFLPGIGSSAAVWLAYGHAAQTTTPSVPFGRGAIEGVIASETANNSKEGGALAPTLFFGIPGSSGMAIMMVALAMMGIEVGPRLVARDPGFVVAVGWTILIANVIAVPLCLSITPILVYLARLKRAEVVVVSLSLATASVLVVAPGAPSVLQLALFGAVGAALARGGWARAPFVLGFVLGPVFESAFARTAAIWGFSALARPGLLTLAALAALVIVVGRRTRRAIERPRDRDTDGFPRRLAALTGVVCLAAGATAILRFPFAAAIAPAAAAAAGTAAMVWLAFRHAIGRPVASDARRYLDATAGRLYGGSLLVALVGGIVPATALLAGGGFYWVARRPARTAIAIGVLSGVAAAVAAGSTGLP